MFVSRPLASKSPTWNANWIDAGRILEDCTDRKLHAFGEGKSGLNYA
jgi:hypothetical protein